MVLRERACCLVIVLTTTYLSLMAAGRSAAKGAKVETVLLAQSHLLEGLS